MKKIRMTSGDVFYISDEEARIIGENKESGRKITLLSGEIVNSSFVENISDDPGVMLWYGNEVFKKRDDTKFVVDREGKPQLLGTEDEGECVIINRNAFRAKIREKQEALARKKEEDELLRRLHALPQEEQDRIGQQAQLLLDNEERKDFFRKELGMTETTLV